MSRLLLDTSAYSAFMRGHAEIQQAIQEADEIFFSPIVLGELLAGFSKGNVSKKNQKELQSFFESPRVKTVSIDAETSECYAAILNSLWSVGTPIPTNDIWIASCAMQHGFKIITTDRHYQKIPQVLVEFFPL